MSIEKFEGEPVVAKENEEIEDWRDKDIDANEGQDFGLYEESVARLSKDHFGERTTAKAIRVDRNELDKRYSYEEGMWNDEEGEVEENKKERIDSSGKIERKTASGAGEKVSGSGYVPEEEYKKLTSAEKIEIKRKRGLGEKLDSIKERIENILEKYQIPEEFYKKLTKEEKQERNKIKQEEINKLFIKKNGKK